MCRVVVIDGVSLLLVVVVVADGRRDGVREQSFIEELVPYPMAPAQIRVLFCVLGRPRGFLVGFPSGFFSGFLLYGRGIILCKGSIMLGF